MNQPSTIHQAVTGHGPALVILHGLFGDNDNFRSIALHLERYFQVIRLDLPGHGQSATLNDLSIDAMADAVAEHLARTGVMQFALLGHSLGGKVAMQMAGARTNPGISKLIIVDIAPRFYPPHHQAIIDALSNLRLDELRTRADAEKQLRVTIADASVRGFLLKNLQRLNDGRYRWRFDLAGLASSYTAIQQAPTFVHQVLAPTLFIKGGNSDYLSTDDEPTIRTHFAHAQLKEIGGTGHWPHADKPALFTRICTEFLSTETNELTDACVVPQANGIE